MDVTDIIKDILQLEKYIRILSNQILCTQIRSLEIIVIGACIENKY